MLKEELKLKIKDMLEKMACKDIEFFNGQDDKLTVKFNCNPLLSFTVDFEEWKYSGIQPNDQGIQKYKIEFKKIIK